MKLAGYIRVSAVMGRSGDSFQSPEQQRRTISGYAKAKGHKVTEWHTDLDQSGGKLSRPAFDEALASVESGKVDGLIVARLDRFARSLVNALSLIERIEGKADQPTGRVLISVHESLDATTPEGRFQRNLFLSLGEFERERISAKWREATQHALARGVPSSDPPFGYRRAADDRYEVDPERGPVVVEIFKRRAAGQSWRTLVDWLNAEHPISNGNGWGIGTLTSIVKRRTYVGEYKGTQQGDPDAPSYYPGHEALVTEAHWVSAQGKKANHSRRGDGGALLQGLLRCSSCGGLMSRRSDGKRGYSNYECRGTKSTCSRRAKVGVTRADAFVEAAILAGVGQDEVTVDHSEGSDEAMTDHEAALTELTAFVRFTPATTPGYAEGLASRQAAVDAAAEKVQRLAAGGTSTVVVADQWRNNEALTVGMKRAVIGAAFSHIEILPSELGPMGSGNRGRSRKQTPVAERMRFHLHDGTTLQRKAVK